MEAYKVKSLSNLFTDKDIENGCFSTSFLSFERAIKETNSLAGVTQKPKGYSVTEEGILIHY